MKKFGKIIVQRDRTGNTSANKCLVTDVLPENGTHRCRLSIDVGELDKSEKMLSGAKYGWISDEGVKQIRQNKGIRVLHVEYIEDFPQNLIKHEIGAKDLQQLEESPLEGFRRIQSAIARKR